MIGLRFALGQLLLSILFDYFLLHTLLLTDSLCERKYHCTADLLFYWFGFSIKEVNLLIILI